ncbi:MAG: MOSC domain-containing protein [Planctomycetota bacterium]
MAGDSSGKTGRVLAVCSGTGGVPNHTVECAKVKKRGLVGDRHHQPRHGGRERAVCLFSIEDYRSLQRDGVVCDEPGTFGENLLVEGLDFRVLRAGDRLAVGLRVVLEIHDVREPCATLKVLDARFPELMVGRSGFVCRVVRGGELQPGQSISLVVRD